MVTYLAQSPGDLHLQMVKNNVELSEDYATKEAEYMKDVVSVRKGNVVKVRHFPNIRQQTIDANFGFFLGFLYQPIFIK